MVDQWIYPKNPEFNGNACIGPDGINIYDHLNDDGKVDWIDIRKQRIRNVGGKRIDDIEIIKLKRGWVIRIKCLFFYLYAGYSEMGCYGWGLSKEYFSSYEYALEISLIHMELY
jgi:hypothetical protein